MIRKINSIGNVYVAVISHNRPHNINKIINLIGNCTFFVNKGEASLYKNNGADNVVECGADICTARNIAILKAAGLPCIQVSDDLRGIKIINPKKEIKGIIFTDVVKILVSELKKTKLLFGGVAVSSNKLNYIGQDFSYDKLVVNDLICIMPTKQPLQFDVSVSLKEDYDMCIRQLISTGGLVRCNHLLCDFPHRENKGGANGYRNSETELQATLKLKAKWGNLVKDNPRRQGQISLNYKEIILTRNSFINQFKQK